jgi:energy-coupling factor transport system permease protein
MRTVLLPENRQTLLTPVNPLLKMGLAFGLVLIALLLQELPAMVILVAGLLLLLTQLTMRAIVVVYGALTLGIFALSIAWIVGSWLEAILNALRLLAILLPGPIFALTTPPTELLRSFQRLRLPSFLTLSLMLLWRFMPLMMQELERIWEANLLRGVDLRRHPTQWFSGLLVPLIFQMVTYADEVTVGLQTRGYDPEAPRSCCKPIRWQAIDSLFCGGVAVWLGIVSYWEWLA